MDELKKLLEKMNREWNDYKEANDKQLAEMKKKGHPQSDITEKLAKMDEAFEAHTKKFEAIEARLNAETQEPEGKDKPEEIQSKAKDAINEYMRKGKMTSEQAEHIKAAYPESWGESKTLSVEVDADGGYLVRPEMATEIRKRIFESSPMRQLAEVMTISSDAIEFPYDNDEPNSGWVGETQARPETDTSQLNMVRIPVHELYAMPKATQKLLDDSVVDMESWHRMKVSSKFARDEEQGFVAGDGVLRPHGITKYANGTGFNQIEQVNSGSAGAFTADGLIDVQGALFEEFQPGASWLLQRASATAVRKLKDSENRYLWSPAGDLVQGAPSLLLGKPVRFADDMPAMASGALAAAYGDFRQGYLIVDRIGIRVLRDPYTQKGFVKFYTTKRVGGGVQQFQAIKLQKLT